jgi:hypothetical protein
VAAGGQKLKQKALKSALRPLAIEPICGVPHQGEHRQEHTMRFGPGLAVLAVIFSFKAGPALASICLGQSMSQEETVAAISATSGCDKAMKLFQDCTYTASGDVLLGEAVEKKCELDFLPRLSAIERRAYQGELKRCDDKYRHKEGTMYVSFTAFCRAEVSQRYARQARKAPR